MTKRVRAPRRKAIVRPRDQAVKRPRERAVADPDERRRAARPSRRRDIETIRDRELSGEVRLEAAGRLVDREIRSLVPRWPAGTDRRVRNVLRARARRAGRAAAALDCDARIRAVVQAVSEGVTAPRPLWLRASQLYCDDLLGPSRFLTTDELEVDLGDLIGSAHEPEARATAPLGRPEDALSWALVVARGTPQQLAFVRAGFDSTGGHVRTAEILGVSPAQVRVQMGLLRARLADVLGATSSGIFTR